MVFNCTVVLIFMLRSPIFLKATSFELSQMALNKKADTNNKNSDSRCEVYIMYNVQCRRNNAIRPSISCKEAVTQL